ncbi:Two-component transcriptional response regulator, LuxR family [Citrifermentans bremense]|uniref:Chemotaxis protein CheY n=2 Tax=Geobacteraceae TaxID=213422 RepID=A0ABQ0MHY5_9BACT|nr:MULTISPECIES: response regulator [Geobacteraceae]BCG47025.1 Two-component transcriptional response regulator, LuxR family [Citrifermentans bremense]GAW66554.1 chemotaxis protein CheY [Geoanaerobacter pelophilus]
MNGEPLCILLVEDNPDHAELAMRNLNDGKLANKIFHVEDGEAALDFLNHRGIYDDPRQFPRPHLILLDLRLPKVDGIEVLKAVKGSEELKAIPVVILTTSAAERDLAQAYQNYANSYLTKPVDFDSFSELLRDMGFYWLAWNKRPW